ncbi:hypothetical protein [Nonomuraea sp. MG754425]|uniref:hypothetical protein n=1 Tax=Nonomuraea sp. MG754425 TaxID=2570319 RepID=UPI001F3F4D64|nr:hypothetical protein [Nonomuraea sp. MG754425]
MWRYLITCGVLLACCLPATPAMAAAEDPRFPSPVDLCTLLTEDAAGKVVPQARRPKGEYAGLESMGCRWVRKGVALGLSVRAYPHESGMAEEPWTHTAAEAHLAFRYLLNGRQRPSRLIIWSANDIGVDFEHRRSATSTTARPLAGIGEEAFAYSYVDKATRRENRVFVVFRVGNLILEVDHVAVENSSRAGTLLDRAAGAAKAAAKTLDRLSPPPQSPPADPPEGTFTSPPLGCGLLTKAQLGDLGVTRDPWPRENCGCHWPDQLEVRFWLFGPGPAGDGPAQAAEVFAAWRTESGGQPLAGSGDEAFTSAGEERVAIFRLGNLIGRVAAVSSSVDEAAAARMIAVAAERSDG